MKKFVLVGLLMTGCTMQPADPAKINYVCAYSGAFEFADSTASKVIPVLGVAIGVDLLNAGVDRICANPQLVASSVDSLIALFKKAGRM